MNFGLKRPCPHCPFRRDVPGYIRPERAQGILDAVVRGDRSFTCHETLSGHYETPDGDDADECDEGATYMGGGRDQFCAGALILLEKLGRPNMLPRIAMALGWWDPDRMRDQDKVHDTEEEMVEHIRRGHG